MNNISDDVICNVSVNATDTTCYCKCDHTFDLLQQLELGTELESDLRDTVDCGRKNM